MMDLDAQSASAMTRMREKPQLLNEGLLPIEGREKPLNHLDQLLKHPRQSKGQREGHVSHKIQRITRDALARGGEQEEKASP